MRSSFFEFQVATTALHTARAGLSVVNHNIANAATKGYSRQYVNIKASLPLNSFGGMGLIGTGSETTGVLQIRNIFLDTKYWTGNSVLGEYGTKRIQLDFMEKIFNGLADSGLNATIDRFFNSVQELTQNPGDGTYRVNMMRAGDSVSSQVNMLATGLQSQQKDINADIRATVQLVNGIGEQIRRLNEQIIKFEMDSSSANDLRDARANLIDELSKFVNVEVKEVERKIDDTNSYMEHLVLINGYTFVNNMDINPLEVVKRDEKLNPLDAPDLYDIYFANTHAKFDIYHPNLQGELKGLIDARDGNNGAHFTTTKTSTVTLNNTAGNVTMTITDPTRADLYAPGNVKIKDTTTGLTRDYRYNSFTLNPDGSVTFKFDEEFHSTVATAINNGDTEISVGKTANYKGIPYYLDKLSIMARTFSKAINEGKSMDGSSINEVTGHINGYDSYGNQKNLFYSYSGIEASNIDPATGAIINYNLMNCFNFSVDLAIKGDPGKIAAALKTDADESENGTLFGIIKINTTRALFSEGKISDFLVGMAGELGIDLKQALNFTLNYTDITTATDIQRRAISSVDLNEETTNSVKFNQMFIAAAKLINIIDDIYNTTINRLGNF